MNKMQLALLGMGILLLLVTMASIMEDSDL